MGRRAEFHTAKVAKLEARLERQLVDAHKRLSKGSLWPELDKCLVASLEEFLGKIRADRAVDEERRERAAAEPKVSDG